MDSLRKKLGNKASGKQGAELFVQDIDGEMQKRIATYSLEDTLMGLEYGAPPDDISLEHIWKEDSFGEDSVAFPNGYRELTDHMARALDDIRIKHPVKIIDYSKKGVVTVHVNDTANDVIKLISAQRVVVTVSLGVLKVGGIQFIPPLPTEKTDAIDRLKMGGTEKVIFQFETKFWDDVVAIVGSTPLETIGHFFDFSFVYGKNVLVGLVPARTNLEPEEFISKSLKELRMVYGEENVPYPTASWISDWKGNKFFLGSYSYIPVGASPNDMRELGKPIDRTHFAGDGTTPEHFGNTHGALLTGYRAADEILNSFFPFANSNEQSFASFLSDKTIVTI